MRGSDIAPMIPEKPGLARDQAILDHVKAGHYVLSWVPITLSAPPYTAKIFVSNDALRLGDKTDSFRVTVSHRGQQMLADFLDAVLPTAKISDEIYKQATARLKPVVLSAIHGTTTPMATRAWMLEHNALVDQQMNAASEHLGFDPADALFAPVGKEWVNSGMLLSRPNFRLCPTPPGQQPKRGDAPAAINYGWQHPMAQGERRSATYADIAIFQPEADCHDISHHDYSQNARLVHRRIFVCAPASVSGFGALSDCVPNAPCVLADGSPGIVQCHDIYNVAHDPSLAALVSLAGPIDMRHFAVPYEGPCAPKSSQAMVLRAAKACWPKPPALLPKKGTTGGGGVPVPPTYVSPETSATTKKAAVFAGGLAAGYVALSLIRSAL